MWSYLKFEFYRIPLYILHSSKQIKIEISELRDIVYKLDRDAL